MGAGREWPQVEVSGNTMEGQQSWISVHGRGEIADDLAKQPVASVGVPQAPDHLDGQQGVLDELEADAPERAGAEHNRRAASRELDGAIPKDAPGEGVAVQEDGLALEVSVPVVHPEISR